MWALTDAFAAWCCASQDNQAGFRVSKGRFNIVHRVDLVAIDQECIARYLAIEYIGENTATGWAPYIVGNVDQGAGTDTFLGFSG